VRPATARVENDTLIYEGSPDVSDRIYFDTESTPYTWYMPGGAVEAGPGCTRQSEPSPRVICPATRSADVKLGDRGKNLFFGPDADAHWKLTSLKVIGGASSDRIAATGPATSATVDGGPGNDTVASSGDAIGGAGNDRVSSAHGTAFGGEGNDRLAGGANEILDGGPGNDTARVRGRNVKVLLGPGNDTFIGYGFNIRVYGGTGNDLIRVPLACTCGCSARRATTPSTR
jgi:Ca2+-binding RTX toxin-like protein